MKYLIVLLIVFYSGVANPMKYLLYLVILVSCAGCVSHQWVELPKSGGGHGTYHAYLEAGTEIKIETDGVGTITFNTKPPPSALDNIVAIAGASTITNLTNGNN